MENDGPEGAEQLLNHVGKVSCVMQSQGNPLAERWIETTIWFLEENLHPGGIRKVMITSRRKKQIGSCLKNCLRKDLFLRYILRIRSKSYKLETRKRDGE